MIRRSNGIGLIFLLGALGASAKDLGSFGTTFPIIEPDMRARLVLEAKQAAVKHGDKMRAEATDSVKNYTSRLTPNELTPVSTTKVVYKDMTKTVSRDIYAPVKQPDGTYKQQVMVAKGTKANALKNGTPTTSMLFIDARDKAQVELMDEILKYDPSTIQPVLVAGDPGLLAKQRNRSIYFAQPWMLEGFGIEHAPAFMKAAAGDKKGSIEVVYLGKPYSSSEIKRRWVPTVQPATAARFIPCTDPQKCGTSSPESSRP